MRKSTFFTNIPITAALSGLIFIHILPGCVSHQSAKPMSSADKARYEAAAETGDAKNPPVFAPGDTLTVDMSGDPSNTAAELPPMPQPIARSFTVTRSDYDAFFSQSPAVILSRLQLDPILDGTSLLGYRIKSINPNFDGVDISAEDIIIGIDGTMIRTPDDYFSAWEKAKKSDACTVNLQRGVERFNLEWKVAP